MAAMDSRQKAKEIYAAARELHLDVLVEIHDFEEMEKALDLSPDMIGVNSRDLKTLTIDTGRAREILNEIPSSVLRVAESGIHSHDDLKAFQLAGADAFLVGESLVTQQDIELATKSLLDRD
jgi:indole-3-glycerol phosphate synthase